MTWFAFWKANEAASGTGPASLLDSKPPASNMSIDYEAGGWTSAPSGRGVRGIGFGVFSAGNKVFDLVQGATALTFEMTLSPNNVLNEFQYWILESVFAETIFSPQFASDGSFDIGLERTPGAFVTNPGIVPQNKISVVHCVWDSNNAAAARRIRAYVNGSRVTSLATYSAPPQGSTIGSESPASTGNTYVLNTNVGDPSASILYQVALASHAASDFEIMSRAAYLLANNDTDPDEQGTSAVLNPFFPVLGGNS